MKKKENDIERFTREMRNNPEFIEVADGHFKNKRTQRMEEFIEGFYRGMTEDK